jgi:hypothetical protein
MARLIYASNMSLDGGTEDERGAFDWAPSDDEVFVFRDVHGEHPVWPLVLGGRTPALPTDTRADLELLDEHRFGNGVVQLCYRVP